MMKLKIRFPLSHTVNGTEEFELGLSKICTQFLQLYFILFFFFPLNLPQSERVDRDDSLNYNGEGIL